MKQTRWKPKMGDSIYSIASDGCIGKYILSCYDTKLREIGNCYRTKREAQEALKRVKKAYNG